MSISWHGNHATRLYGRKGVDPHQMADCVRLLPADTIARGKVIGVNEGVVTVKPMVSRTNVAKLQSLASTNTMVGVNAIENKMKTFG